MLFYDNPIEQDGDEGESDTQEGIIKRWFK